MKFISWPAKGPAVLWASADGKGFWDHGYLEKPRPNEPLGGHPFPAWITALYAGMDWAPSAGRLRPPAGWRQVELPAEDLAVELHFES